MNDGDTVQSPPAGHEPDAAIAAYALGLLDTGEARVLKAHLAGCPMCHAELQRHEAVVGELGYMATPIEPRPELRAALLAEIRAPAASPVAPTPLGRQVPVLWLAIAASIAIISIAILGTLLLRTMDERDDAVYGEREIAEYLSSGGTLSPLLPAPGAPPDVEPGHGSLAVAPDQSQAMLVLHDVPSSDDDRRYVAWAARDGEQVEFGELTVNDEGVGWLLLTGPEPMSSYDTVGITRYVPDAPEGQPFLVASVE